MPGPLRADGHAAVRYLRLIGGMRSMATSKRCLTSRLARWAAIASIASGALVLAGWQFDVLALRFPLPRSTPVNPATGICFILGGVALWLRLRPGLAANLAGRICAVALAAVGLLKLMGMLGIVGLLPDCLLYTSPSPRD